MKTTLLLSFLTLSVSLSSHATSITIKDLEIEGKVGAYKVFADATLPTNLEAVYLVKDGEAFTIAYYKALDYPGQALVKSDDQFVKALGSQFCKARSKELNKGLNYEGALANLSQLPYAQVLQISYDKQKKKYVGKIADQSNKVVSTIYCSKN